VDALHEKLQALKTGLLQTPDLAVAYSAGVDSTFLLMTAVDTLGTDHVLALTAHSVSFPEREAAEAETFCQAHGIRHHTITVDQLSIPGFRKNPVDRCYLCKKDLFQTMQSAAAEEGFAVLAEGSNVDDLSDYRPGRRAIQELGIQSPLQAAGLTKADIRALSRERGLPTWSKPSLACLATRFPYNTELTEDAILRVDAAEGFLFDLGFSQVRVRSFATTARVEVAPGEVDQLLAQADSVIHKLQTLGFCEVELSREGYRTGSMNVIDGKELT